MQWKRDAVAGLLLAGVCLGGCHSYLPPPPPPTHAGKVVRVWCPPALADLVHGQSAAWQARQQATVVAQDGPAGADVWVVAPADLPRHAAEKKLAPVPDHLSATATRTDFDWPGLLALYREHLVQWNGARLAVPLVGESLVCLYDANLYADPKHQAGYAASQKGETKRPLRRPLTWEELEQQAKYFGQALGKPVLPALPNTVEGLDRLYHAIAASHARRAVPEDEKPRPGAENDLFFFHYDRDRVLRIASGGFVDAVKQLHRLRPLMAKGDDSLHRGDFVLAIGDASLVAALQRNPKTRDRFNVCPVPGVAAGAAINRVPYVGGAGWLAAVPTGAKEAEAAWDLLADLAGPMRSMQIAMEPQWGGGVTRTAQLLRERWGAFGLDVARTQALREAIARTVLQHGLKNPLMVLRTPDQAQRREALVRAVRAAVEDGKAEEHLKAAANVWKELDAKNRDAWADYRRSLGLAPE